MASPSVEICDIQKVVNAPLVAGAQKMQLSVSDHVVSGLPTAKLVDVGKHFLKRLTQTVGEDEVEKVRSPFLGLLQETLDNLQHQVAGDNPDLACLTGGGIWVKFTFGTITAIWAAKQNGAGEMNVGSSISFQVFDDSVDQHLVTWNVIQSLPSSLAPSVPAVEMRRFQKLSGDDVAKCMATSPVIDHQVAMDQVSKVDIAAVLSQQPGPTNHLRIECSQHVVKDLPIQKLKDAAGRFFDTFTQVGKGHISSTREDFLAEVDNSSQNLGTLSGGGIWFEFNFGSHRAIWGAKESRPGFANVGNVSTSTTIDRKTSPQLVTFNMMQNMPSIAAPAGDSEEEAEEAEKAEKTEKAEKAKEGEETEEPNKWRRQRRPMD